MPIYLIGLYKFADEKIEIATNNKPFIDFIEYLEKNENRENKLVCTFTGEIDFLNRILDKGYNDFCEEYRMKNLQL